MHITTHSNKPIIFFVLLLVLPGILMSFLMLASVAHLCTAVVPSIQNGHYSTTFTGVSSNHFILNGFF